VERSELDKSIQGSTRPEKPKKPKGNARNQALAPAMMPTERASTRLCQSLPGLIGSQLSCLREVPSCWDWHGCLRPSGICMQVPVAAARKTSQRSSTNADGGKVVASWPRTSWPPLGKGCKMMAERMEMMMEESEMSDICCIQCHARQSIGKCECQENS
jgi:hypothetical protein